jgi:hypothetical protein
MGSMLICFTKAASAEAVCVVFTWLGSALAVQIGAAHLQQYLKVKGAYGVALHYHF